MEIKKKFEKNIFTEVIEDKSQNNQKEKEENNNNQINISKEEKDEQKEQTQEKNNEENKISQKNQKTVKKIKEICSQDFISIEELRNICWKGIPSEDIRRSINKSRMLENIIRFISSKKGIKNKYNSAKERRIFRHVQCIFKCTFKSRRSNERRRIKNISANTKGQSSYNA